MMIRRNRFAEPRVGRNYRHFFVHAVAILLGILMLSSGAFAQKKKKDKNPPVDTSPMPAMPLPLDQQIDHNIGEMLGAFQAGDVEAMHKYYAENATFVSGAYAPPVVGWQNYAAQYQRERSAFQGMELIRRNTYIFHSGDVAWASYQWEFNSMFNGKPYFAEGQTTLIFVKSGDDWLIVHNHTSEICPAVAQSGPANQQPMQNVPRQNPAVTNPSKP
ncbi:MAG: YybH family protein [Candidatus Acidiferrales bacterium]